MHKDCNDDIDYRDYKMFWWEMHPELAACLIISIISLVALIVLVLVP